MIEITIKGTTAVSKQPTTLKEPLQQKGGRNKIFHMELNKPGSHLCAKPRVAKYKS